MNNNRKKVFEIKTSSQTLCFPHAKAEPSPSAADPVREVFVDKELGSEAFTYVLESGKNGTVHIEQVLEYNQDPRHLRDALLYKLTVEAQKRLEGSGLSKREVIRRLGTSAAQLYRLLDQKNYRKSIDQLLFLLQVFDCDIDLVVRAREGSQGKRRDKEKRRVDVGPTSLSPRRLTGLVTS
jgi:predicted XRE-type DNA-binding protein